MKEKKRQKIEQIGGKYRREGKSPAKTCLDIGQKKLIADSNRINMKTSLN